MNEELAVRTRTLRTILSLSANVSVTNALGQSPRLVFEERHRQREDFLRVLTISDDVGVGVDTPLPIFSKSNCTDRHERRKPSASIKTSAGRHESSVPVRSGAGVNTDKSSGWSLTGVSGRLSEYFQFRPTTSGELHRPELAHRQGNAKSS